MKRILKNNGYLLIVFIIFFIFLYFINFQNNFKDSLINYAFAKAIVEGEIPYLDFNLISTPLFTFVTSIGLFICNNYLTFLIEQTLLLTICYYLLHRLFGRKSILFLLIAPLTYCANIMPTYNFMCFFMIIVIIYMENNHSDKDYLIGILIALALFSKQTVGFFTIFPSIIFYHNNLDKLKKRFVGFLIPCIIFLLYLILNKALYEFFDLCLFGMVDFLNYNGFKRGLIKEYIELRCLILFCVCTFIMLYLLKKNKRDINLLYLLNGVLFLFPLFDLNHLAYFLNCFVVAILPYIKLNEKILYKLSLMILIFYCGFITFYNISKYDLILNKKFRHFENILYDKNYYEQDMLVNNFINKYQDKGKNVIVIGFYSARYNINNDNKITYFDVFYEGNFGYNGTKKMIEKIKKMHNYYFFVSKVDVNNKKIDSQINKDVAKYIMNNCKKVDSFKVYNVYYKN